VSLAADAACASVAQDFAAAWWLLAEASGAELHESAELRWYHSGRDDAYCNAVLVTWQEGTDADATIGRTIDELRSRGAPFTWWVMPGDRPTDLADRLGARGLVPDRPWRGMAASTADVAEPPAVAGLEVRRVATQDDLDTFVQVFAPILSSSDAFTRFFADAARATGFAEDAAGVHFVGWLHGEPVATTSLLTAAGSAGIYNVTTREPARGRGIGAAMTATAVAVGRSRGLSVTTLQASDMGRPVYERLGFRASCDLVPFRSA
jgi:GNAT superfamily N-acetyltransferase